MRAESVILATQATERDSDSGFTSELLINCYAEEGPNGAKSPLLIRSTPGLTTGGASSAIGAVVIRDMAVVNGTLYVAAGGALYSVDSAGTATNLGSIADHVETYISSNGSNVTVAANGTYSLWDGATMTTPGSGRISDGSVGSVAFLDQYTVLGADDSGEIEWTTLATPETRDATYFLTAESHDDDLVRVMATSDLLVLFGEASTEFVYNTGESGASAFLPVTNAVLDRGLLSARLAAFMEDQGLHFIGNDKRVYRLDGSAAMPVSTPAQERDIAASTPTHVFWYEDEGHKFLVVRFSDRPAWCYDTVTGLWHQRATGANHDAWEVTSAVRAYGTWYAGTTAGNVRLMSRTNDDDGTVMVRRVQSRPLYQAGERFRVHKFEVVCRTGQAAQTLTAQFSRDGGRTWGLQHDRSTGAVGEYETRPTWRGLGQFRDFTARLDWSGTGETSLYGIANVGVS